MSNEHVNVYEIFVVNPICRLQFVLHDWTRQKNRRSKIEMIWCQELFYSFVSVIKKRMFVNELKFNLHQFKNFNDKVGPVQT